MRSLYLFPFNEDAENEADDPRRKSLFFLLLLKFLIRSSGFLAAGRALVGFSGILAVPALCLIGKVWLMKEMIHFYHRGNRIYIVLVVAWQLAKL